MITGETVGCRFSWSYQSHIAEYGSIDTLKRERDKLNGGSPIDDRHPSSTMNSIYEDSRCQLAAERGTLGNVHLLSPEDTNYTLTTSSSQLLSCPTDNAQSPSREWGAISLDGGTAFQDFSSTHTSNSESCFILDEGGRYVLDDQGSPARTRKWQPTNATQRAQYTRLQLATKGPRATCRWLPSVLVTPDYLRLPRARSEGENEGLTRGIFVQHEGASIITNGGCGNGYQNIAAQQRREIDKAKKRRRLLAEEKKRKRPKELDGFMLMDACGCELPDEGRRADVSGRGLVAVVQEDLRFFVRLQIIDASDNNLCFESFACLPRLEELRFPCNGIRDVLLPTGGYNELTRLDLSYNSLSNTALSVLGRLPNLVDLDLTGNGLAELPQAMKGFSRLQKLSLERNELEGDMVIDVLSKLPALRELDVAFNYFTGVILAPEAIEYAFPSLECLDLCFNYITRQDDVSVLVLLERLQRIILYGNPLMGPTGEDPLGLCVKRLLEKADSTHERWASSPLEIVTEMPRKNLTKDGGARRRRPYSDIGVTMVDDGCLPSSAAFRAAGNEYLFRTEALLRHDPSESRGEKAIKSAKDHSTEGTGSRPTVGQDATFMTGLPKHDNVETLPDVNAYFCGAAGETYPGHSSVPSRLLFRPADPAVRRDPVKLRMAFVALRHTLKHPVLSSMDFPWGAHGEGGCAINDKAGGVCRSTAAARARQMPRRPYRFRTINQKGFCERMLHGPTSSSNLGAVDHVLASMGTSMD